MDGWGFDEILSSLKDKYREISGVRVTEASDVGIKFRAISFALAQTIEKLEKSRSGMFLQTATEGQLDLFGKMFGLKRRGQKSVGKLRFFKARELKCQLEIPKGIHVTTGGQGVLRVVTTEERKFNEDETFVDVAAESEQCGEEFNFVSGGLTVLCDEIEGIVDVTNPEEFTGGKLQEEDEIFRQRMFYEIKEALFSRRTDEDA
ncbi:MAG: baseplate J/gp47 family protein [Oscillospiraceae bacterium]|jgi:uncharacterized phage protein gp47/JayE|nr:baseplate J/gp47 family protein [Oscillospiraceae bacterium]